MQDGMKQYFTRGRRRRAWQKVVRAMACIVVFCTVYALILPAITMEQDLSCLLEEHTHTDSCYTQVTVVEQTALHCSKSALNLHTHTTQCYTEGEVRCGYSDFVVHSHGPLCRDGEGNLVCDLPVIPEHTHTDACYEIRMPEVHTHSPECYALALACPHVHEDGCYAAGGAPTCGLQETAGHTHGANCMESTLICEETAEDHVHETACYQQNLVCAQEETAAHSHESGCYTPELACPHIHEESCWLRTEELVCGKEETAGTEEPLPEQVLVCSLGEVKLHTHGDGCFDGNGALVCPLQQVLSHVHGEDCMQTLETAADTQSLTCGLEEGENHTHSPRCYGQWNLTCELEEHTHTELCYSGKDTPDSAEKEAPADEPADGETTPTEEAEIAGEALPVAPEESMLLAELPDELVAGGAIDGTELTWSFTKNAADQYTLTIDGNGAIPAYSQNASNPAPWKNVTGSLAFDLVFGPNVTSVGSWSFHGMRISSIAWGGVTEVNGSAFRGVWTLEELTIPSTIKRIESYAFNSMQNLKQLTLEDGVEYIGEGAFSTSAAGFSGIPVHIPASVKEIPGAAFSLASEFTVDENNQYFTAEDGVLFSKDMTKLVQFPQYKVLEEYRIPHSVTYLSRECLGSVKYVDRLYIPNSLTGNGAYPTWKSNYKEIYFEDGIKLGGYQQWFWDDSQLRVLRFPENTAIKLNNYLFHMGTYPYLESIKFPNAITEIGFFGQSSCHFPALKTVVYDSANAKITAASPILADAKDFELTIGPSVDVLPTEFNYFAKTAATILFAPDNSFIANAGAFSGAGAPLEDLSGTLYADSQGALYSYDAKTKTAALVYCPVDKVSITVPASITPEDGLVCQVDRVEKDSLLNAGKLTSLIFADPSAITQLEGAAMANCPTLASVNGKTTVEDASAIFTNVTEDNFGGNVFFNTGLMGAENADNFFKEMNGEQALAVNKEGATEMRIELVSSGNTMQWVSAAEGKTTGGYHLLTGDTLTINAVVGNIAATTDNVYRIYFRVTNGDGSMNIEPGKTYFFGNVAASCHATKDPYTIYLEFAPLIGETNSVFATNVYASPRSAGGGLSVWGMILSQEDAANKTGQIIEAVDSNKIQAYWETKPDDFKLEKTTGNTSAINIISNDAGGAKPGTNLSWQIVLSRATEVTSAYGKDYVKSVDYTDTLHFPSGMRWNSVVVDSVMAGNVHAEGTALYAGDIQVANLSCTGATLLGATLVWDSDQGTVAIRWNTENSGTDVEMNTNTLKLDILADAISIDMEDFDQNTTEYTNMLQATLHYYHGEDVDLNAQATHRISGGQGTVKIKKTSSYGNKDIPYFGEDVTYTIDLYNDGGLPYYGTEGVFTLCDTMAAGYPVYIRPENMERMFNEDPNLVIRIEKALLAPWVPVVGVDGNTAWQNSGNTGTGDSQKSLRITCSEEGYSVEVSGGETYTADSAAAALQAAGYAVTFGTEYYCEWLLNEEDEPFTLDSGEHEIRYVYATFKDTFRNLSTKDFPTQWIETTRVQVRNRVNVFDPSGKSISTTHVDTYIKREAILTKEVYKNGERMPDIDATHGDVLDYQLNFSHIGRGSYENLPLVDDLYGSQYLLVAVSDNSSLAQSGLPIHTVDNVQYYVLTEGHYTDVVVGVDDEGVPLHAASVTVSESTDDVQIDLGGQTTVYSGIHTKIKWYFPSLEGGNYHKTVSYKALVDLTGSKSEYTLGNVAWVNDDPGSRLYAPLWGGGTIIDFEKMIVTEKGASPEDDVLETYSIVGPGEDVTYRLMLRNTGSFAYKLTGDSFADALPNDHEVIRWQKDLNVKLSEVRWDGEGVVMSGLEDWHIGTEYNGISGGGQSYILWDNSAYIDFAGEGTVYLYFTLTFPEDAGSDLIWSEYAASVNGNKVNNTMFLHTFSSTVSHNLKETGQVLLQKGVYGMYHHEAPYSSTIYYHSGASRYFYNNRDSRGRAVAYYVILINNGNKRLYIDEMQDILPEGFTFMHLLDDGAFAEARRYSSDRIVTKGGYAPFGEYPIADIYPEGILYRSIDVDAKITEKGVNFSFEAGTGNYAALYDEERGQYYLNSGEGIVFAYTCDIGTSSETQDSATNVVVMPYTDYLDTGALVSEDLKAIGAQGAYFTNNNDGACNVISGQIARNKGFTGDAELWLASDVTVHRGGIIPGITKSTASYLHVPTEIVTEYKNSVGPGSDYVINWQVKLHNSGTLSMTDYTFTDIMPNPYLFQGDVKFTIFDCWGTKMFSDVLVSIPARTGGETQLNVLNNVNTAYVLKTDGTPLRMRGSYNNTSVEFSVLLYTDKDGNEVLSLCCDQAYLSVPEGGYVLVELSSRNPTTEYNNAVYTNMARLIPNTQPFESVGQGSMLRDENNKPLGAENSAAVTVSFGYSTGSWKQVTEKARPENTVSSKDAGNRSILLEGAQSVFTYTLNVSNDTDRPMTKLVMIDNLAHIGDHSPFKVDAPRNSEFTVYLADDQAIVITVTPYEESQEPYVLDPSEYIIQYSTATDFGKPNGPDWSGAMEGTTAHWTSNPDGARSIRLIIQDENGTLIPPKSTVSMSFDAVAGPDADYGEIAWNSFGYHYGLKSVVAELEAMPLTVGVSIPGIPTLEKRLVDQDGAPALAEEATSFAFLVYQGDALTGEYASEDAFTAALTEAGRAYNKVELTVPAGSSKSQQYKLDFADWTWQEGQKYTVVELPTPEKYAFLRFEGTSTESYTFFYDSAGNQSIQCVNKFLSWSAEVTKTNDSGEFLSGAVFGLYSPVQTEQLASIPAEYVSLGIPETITQEGGAWYLTALAETDETGELRFADLLQDAYYLREVKAPDGYMLPAEVWKLTRQGSTDGVYAQSVVNYAVYELPDTGGAGRNQYVLGGILLTVLALAYIHLKRRGEANVSP